MTSSEMASVIGVLALAASVQQYVEGKTDRAVGCLVGAAICLVYLILRNMGRKE
jgi:Ca2+/Na+ antiporter